MYPKNESFIIQIDSIAYGGRGVGRKEDGKVVFVTESIPGEVVRVKATKEHKNYILADNEETITASPNRVQAPCKYFSVCGGCDWQHISYPEQVSFKQDILLGHIKNKCPRETPDVEEMYLSPREYGYRCHTIIRCMHNPGFDMGYYRKLSNTVVPNERCMILHERIQQIQNCISRIMKESSIKNLISFEIHALQEKVLVQALYKGRLSPSDRDTFGRLFDESGIHGLSTLEKGSPESEYIWGNNSSTYPIPVQGKSISFSACFGSFIQVNPMVNEALVNHVVNLAAGSKNVLDLFCGNGNFTIPIAQVSSEVLGVEKEAGLTKLGKANAEMNGCQNVIFSSLEAQKALESFSGKKHFDTVVLDPPREGAKEEVLALAKMKPDRIIYISCDPSTLSRDLEILINNGYKLRKIRLFDMFPQTYHMETVSYLEL